MTFHLWISQALTQIYHFFYDLRFISKNKGSAPEDQILFALFLLPLPILSRITTLKYPIPDPSQRHNGMTGATSKFPARYIPVRGASAAAH